MQFEDFDKKIKEAAEHHHPAYDEKAWDKMEKLLDKHMPTEKDDRRRIFFFLLVFLGAALLSGIYYVKTIGTNHHSEGLTGNVKKESLQQSPTNQKSGDPANTADHKSAGKSTTLPLDKAEDALVTDANNNPVSKMPAKEGSTKKATGADANSYRLSVKGNILPDEHNITNPRLTLTGDKKRNLSAIDYTSVASAGKLQPASKSATQQSSAGPATIVSENSTTGITTIDPSAKNNPDNSNNNTVAGKPLTADATLPKKAVDTVKTKAETNNPVAQQKPTPKPGSQKKSAFAITFTALPDLSVVGTNRTGKIKMGYGAGLSYTLNRITFRSGFYVGKKVYTAGPDEYHSKNPWPGNFILDKVDADCKVYEIPFLLSYNFSQSKRSNWFFSSGLSTYLMKRETYGYYYEYRGSPTVYQKTTTINNEYKHFFSIVNLSAGYERKLNNRLSITAEPYIKVPLDGIGYGKIQLNSAGVAVTLSVKPFAPKK